MKLLRIFRAPFFSFFLTIVIAIQLINLSINTGDLSHVDDQKVNEIESCVELVLEVFMGNHNAIEEHDEQEHAGSRPAHHLLLFAYKINYDLAPLYPEIMASAETNHFFVSIKSHPKPIDPPPPWSCHSLQHALLF